MLGRRRVEPDDGSPPVGGVLAAVDEAVSLELGRQLAGRWERDADRVGDLADGLRALGSDLRQCSDVTPAEPGLSGDEREQLRGAAPAPQPAHHLSQGAAKLRELGAAHLGNTCLLLTVIIR